MKFTPGQKVWVMHHPTEGVGPSGEYAGIIVGHLPHKGPDIYEITVEEIPPKHDYWWTHERYLRPRDDPPQREPIGEWELCPWKPSLPVTVRADDGI